ncbi:MAG TPA: altronate dehydratase family protein [Candidatus Acidoferrum sp.]|nr:altronate dehydratase family protein [Candidatus Acidoferrum sp.]
MSSEGRGVVYNSRAVSKVLQIDPRDNVLIALADLRRGECVSFDSHNYVLETDVAAKHKFAREDLAAGANVIMYGVIVGKAVAPIRRAEAITTKNIRHDAAPFREKSREFTWTPLDVTRWRERTFAGYRRADGQVGTRNYWLVVPLVFCENRNIVVMKQAFEEELGFAAPQIYRSQVAELARLYQQGKRDEIEMLALTADAPQPRRSKIFKNVDGIKFLLHEGGCGGTREDSNNLCGLIAGYLHHPNVAGGTILSLGCQHAEIAILREELRKLDANFAKPLVIVEQQQSGTEAAMMTKAIRKTFLGLMKANECERTAVPLSKLCLGLKCGGSDGFSGISANPAIGYTADLLVSLGGKGILSEFPELCGVEQELIDRSVRKEVGDRFMDLMKRYGARAKAVGSGFEMNPSPGNIRDGLLTDAMKSAGAARKGGTSPVTAVLDYPEYATKAGLNLQCTPGNDVECLTAQVGAGANVVLFTTGLGTPTGNPVAPVVKLATNSELARRMPDIIDVDTGGIISGEKTLQAAGEEILEFVVRVASGEVRTKAEEKGQEDFIPWKRGVSL